MIGGGSYSWTPGLIGDFLLNDFLDDITICLMDVNGEALEELSRLCHLYGSSLPSRRIRFQKTTDYAEALSSSSFVIVSISHGHLEAELEDHRITRRYGFYNIKGSEVGVAGCSRTLRHVPELVRIARLMERHCPRAMLLNVTNPLTALTRAVGRYTSIRCAGFCHGVMNHLQVLFPLFGAESWDEVDFTVAGIDHLSWLLDVRHKGRDALAIMRGKGLVEAARRGASVATYDDPFAGKENQRLRFLLWDILGYLPAISDEHCAEFFGQFMRTAETRQLYGITYDRIRERVHTVTRARESVRGTLASGKPPALQPSGEIIAAFIAALNGAGPAAEVMNYPNEGQIPNLPLQSVVETRCRVDATGVHPVHAGTLPPILESIVRPILLREELYMDAAMENNPGKLAAALSMDPIVSDFTRIRELSEELLAWNNTFRRGA